MTSAALPAARRVWPLVAAGVAIVAAVAVLGPRVGPIGTGTLIALAVAVLATRFALNTGRQTRL